MFVFCMIIAQAKSTVRPASEKNGDPPAAPSFRLAERCLQPAPRRPAGGVAQGRSCQRSPAGNIVAVQCQVPEKSQQRPVPEIDGIGNQSHADEQARAQQASGHASAAGGDDEGRSNAGQNRPWPGERSEIRIKQHRTENHEQPAGTRGFAAAAAASSRRARARVSRPAPVPTRVPAADKNIAPGSGPPARRNTPAKLRCHQDIHGAQPVAPGRSRAPATASAAECRYKTAPLRRETTCAAAASFPPLAAKIIARDPFEEEIRNRAHDVFDAAPAVPPGPTGRMIEGSRPPGRMR